MYLQNRYYIEKRKKERKKKENNRFIEGFLRIFRIIKYWQEIISLYLFEVYFKKDLLPFLSVLSVIWSITPRFQVIRQNSPGRHPPHITRGCHALFVSHTNEPRQD